MGHRNSTVVLFLLFFISVIRLFGQSHDLKEKLRELSDGDTNKAWIYVEISHYYYENGGYDSAYLYGARGYLLSHRLGHFASMYKSINNAALSLSALGRDNEAISLYNVGLAYSRAYANPKTEVKMLNGLGICETRKGNYQQAIKYYLDALKMQGEVGGGEQLVANLTNNIGVVYKRTRNFEQARKYARMALAIRIKLKDSTGIATSYNNLANSFSYNTPADCDSVFHYYNRALSLRKKIGDEVGIAQSLTNLGNYYLNMEEPKKALDYFLRGYEMNTKLGIVAELINGENNISETYYDLKQFEKAREYGEAGLKRALENGFTDDESSSRKKLAKIYLALGDYKRSAGSFDRYVEIRDTFFSQTLEDKVAEARFNYEFERKADKLKQEQEIKDAIAAEEKRAQRFIIWGVSGFGLLVLAFAIFAYRSFLQKKRANILISQQKREVEDQKHVIEEKQKEIIDSIYYARRIQRSLLTKEKYIDKTLRKLKG